ncbi:bifunctional tRNA (mnm(5)s(2)U34)-methyltransferase/FAD-dependent cmnm(5)s(2)U34 oxidoreductase [Aminobacter sp. MSH1]|uniref:NAD(P)/FAD-dependent oxidoreductase n=1 Tax=Aminobacter sp. MSH1 TaxID=374606 RepID=UPI000D37DCB3|nr:FAD-dependent oxidoreductase [Aminobacter sp. MSH1]AWC22684.1 bifunctional tRNA (mnm(5)s(2)U34)-methyltransferase/FAD-dependent cmnm(5)s(2)U34 oxidoreductase [Aminobacter sp. MSH1]
MTRKLDLRTGRPVWYAYRAPTVATGRLVRDIKADVAIVGMGISGAMVAEALTDAGMSVVCIDRRGPLLGSTSATTALVQYEIDQPLSRLAQRIGKDRAERAWRRSRLAVMNLKARIDELGINCNVETRQSLYLAGYVLDADSLHIEAAARRLAGIHATYLPKAELRERFGIARNGAILSHGNLALDPRKLTAGLLLTARQRKARFYAPAEATGIATSRDEVTVTTGDGPTITASHAVLATGYELVAGFQAGTDHQIISTWAIATRPQKRALWPGAAFIWEASDPYLYLRATSDGRVICGGEDEEFTDEARRDALIAEKSDRIAAKLKRLLPELDTSPEFAWTGSFGTTATGLPYIGTLPRHPRIHAVMGYGGNGITYSRIAAEIVSAALCGNEDTDAGLFGFRR